MPDKTAESEFDYIEENEPQPATPMTPEELAALPPPEDGPAEQVPVPAEAPEGWEQPTKYPKHSLAAQLPESAHQRDDRGVTAAYAVGEGPVTGVDTPGQPQPQNVPHQESLDGSPCMVELFQRNPRVEGDETISAGLHYGTITFQCGPIAEVGINGGTIEGVITVLKERLEGFQRGPFACEENSTAIVLLQRVLNVLALRTRRRKEQGVEGTNAPHQEA